MWIYPPVAAAVLRVSLLDGEGGDEHGVQLHLLHAEPVRHQNRQVVLATRTTRE